MAQVHTRFHHQIFDLLLLLLPEFVDVPCCSPRWMMRSSGGKDCLVSPRPAAGRATVPHAHVSNSIDQDASQDQTSGCEPTAARHVSETIQREALSVLFALGRLTDILVCAKRTDKAVMDGTLCHLCQWR